MQVSIGGLRYSYRVRPECREAVIARLAGFREQHCIEYRQQRFGEEAA